MATGIPVVSDLRQLVDGTPTDGQVPTWPSSGSRPTWETPTGGGGGNNNYFGDGSDGNLDLSTNTSWPTSTNENDTGVCVINALDLIIRENVTLQPEYRSRVFVINVDGDLELEAGAIILARGAAAAPVQVDISAFLEATSGQIPDLMLNVLAEASVSYTITAAGPAGGATAAATGNQGVDATGFSCGGGGSGAGGAAPHGTGGAGSAATAFSGGAGGGGGGYTTVGVNGEAGGTNGGKGGDGATSGNTASAGGAGNPGGTGTGTSPNTGSNGATGTGGTVIIRVRGNVTMAATAKVRSPGYAGGAATITNGAMWRTQGGGGSGAGVILLMYGGTLNSAATQTNNYTVTLANGAVLECPGGAGGVGSGGVENYSGGRGGHGAARVQPISGAA
jgi:hypothetical protein